MPPNLPVQVPVVASKVTLAATAALAGPLFTDKRYAISIDLNQVHQEKEFGKRLQDKIRILGQDPSLHHMLKLADPRAEALWLEGRRWSYSELILESNKLTTILHQKGVVAGDAVAVFAINSPEMVIAIAATAPPPSSGLCRRSSIRPSEVRTYQPPQARPLTLSHSPIVPKFPKAQDKTTWSHISTSPPTSPPPPHSPSP